MKSPLRKRQFRMLKTDWKKYAVLFLLLVLTIGFVAGMFVANDSMETAALEAYDKYHIEHGHFELKDPATDNLLADYEEEGIQVYQQFYKDFEEDADLDGEEDAKIRVFKIRQEVNQACLMSGEFPKAENEIAIDRMHASNLKIQVGDEIGLNDTRLIVTGLIASSDYSTLYENPTDLMFDALTFDIGLVTDEGYEALKAKERYQYAYLFDRAPADEEEQKKMSDTLVEQLAVLSATGGYTDDKDEAEKLKDDIEAWKDYLEEIQEKADRATELKEYLEKIQTKADRVSALQKELEAEQEKIMEAASDQQKVMEILSQAGYDLTQIMGMDQAQISEIVQKALVTDAMQAKIDELTALGEELSGQQDEINAAVEELEALGKELEAEETKIDETVDRLEELEDYEDDMNELTAFVPEYANQAIHFAPTDMGSDKAMGEVLMIMLVAILAFIFAVTVNNTIVNDSAVIGTLRASGYTRWELLRHYTALPITVSLIAALIGNILGYTLLKYVVVSMYYNSYSLPTYETRWNGDAFVKTTVIPIVLVIAIILFIVARKLKISPLKFLHHDLSTSKRKRAMKLPNFKFMTRFRIRIFLQSIGDYVVLCLGVCFVAMLMYFAIGLPATLNHYTERFSGMLVSEYQYVLKDYKDSDGELIVTDTPGAEKFSLKSFKTIDGVHVGEEISVYGLVKDSIYFRGMEELDAVKTTKQVDAVVAVSNPYSEKFGLKVGDIITLKESYKSDTYRFYVGAVMEYDAALAVFMPQEIFNELFDLEKEAFSGYLSDAEIKDIDDEYIIQEITVDDYLKIVNQLNHSMGDYMDYFAVICIGMAVLLIYLLTKLIVEKNAVSISMAKVLGYTNGEINSIYILLTSIVVVISALLALVVAKAGLAVMWKGVLAELNGWFSLYMGLADMLKVLGMIIIAYVIVSFFDMRRIRRVPLTEALKNVE